MKLVELTLLLLCVVGSVVGGAVVRTDEEECAWRHHTTKDLDLALLRYDLLTMRIMIQQQLEHLEVLYKAVETGHLLDSECLYPLRRFMSSSANMENFRACTTAFLPVLDNLTNSTSTSS